MIRLFLRMQWLLFKLGLLLTRQLVVYWLIFFTFGSIRFLTDQFDYIGERVDDLYEELNELEEFLESMDD